MVAEAKSSSDVRIYLSDGTPPEKVTITAVTKAKPAVITVGVADISKFALDAPIYIQGSGFAELDNHFFLAGVIDDVGGTVELQGSDTTDSTGTLAPGAEAEVYDNTELTPLCLSLVTYNLETPGTASVGTYCNPKATLPATAGAPGTMTLSGYIDVQDSAYPAVYQGVQDGKDRILSVLLGKGQGELIQEVVLASMTWDIPMGDGGMAWTATATLKTQPEHIFESAPAAPLQAARVREPDFA